MKFLFVSCLMYNESEVCDMSKFINNKEVSTILSELSVFEETSKKTYQGYDYREIEDFYNRLWDVCGKENVVVTSLSTTPPIFTNLPTGQVLCSAYIEVSIYYDDGSLWRTVGSWGEMEVIYSEKNSRYDGIGNIIDVASAKALKLALKKLDVFGTYSLQKKETKTSSSKSKPKASEKENKVMAEGVFSLKGLSQASVVRTDKTTNKPVYAWSCEQDGKEYNVVFYPNAYKEDEDWLNRLIKQLEVKPSTLINIRAKELPDKDGVKQLIFTKRA